MEEGRPWREPGTGPGAMRDEKALRLEGPPSPMQGEPPAAPAMFPGGTVESRSQPCRP
jgi:hypothetical protein